MTVLKVGDVIEVDERHYRYGTGTLVMRVTRIDERTRAADGVWLDLEGLALRADGTQLDQRPRPAAVRVGSARIRRVLDARP